MKVNIVVPIYREKLDHSELISLKQLFKVLSNYPITVIHPQKVSLSFLAKEGFIFNSYSFDNAFFDGIYGYNKLTLSSEFYEKFLDSEYMLIYQTDAYVFKDDLLKWCAKGYDYIGSPWVTREQTYLHKTLHKFNNLYRRILNKKEKGNEHYFKVGNGGLSLRKTRVFYDLSVKYREYIEREVIGNTDSFKSEDVFWSLEIPNKEDSLNVPDYKQALEFGFDRRPSIAYKENHHQLPFGVHGINRKDRIKFFRQFIEGL